MYSIRFAEGVEEDLDKIRVYYRNQILAAINPDPTLNESPVRQAHGPEVLEGNT